MNNVLSIIFVSCA